MNPYAASDIVVVLADLEVIGPPTRLNLFLQDRIALHRDGLGLCLRKHVRRLSRIDNQLTRGFDHRAVQINNPRRPAAKPQHVTYFHVVTCLRQEAVTRSGYDGRAPVGQVQTDEL